MIKGEVTMEKLREQLTKLDGHGGTLVEPMRTILEYLIEKEKEEGPNEYVFKTKDETEFLYAFHGLDFLLVLWNLDQSLRNKIKYSQDLNEEVKTGLQMARTELYEILESKNLSLDMLS